MTSENLAAIKVYTKEILKLSTRAIWKIFYFLNELKSSHPSVEAFDDHFCEFQADFEDLVENFGTLPSLLEYLPKTIQEKYQLSLKELEDEIQEFSSSSEFLRSMSSLLPVF